MACYRGNWHCTFCIILVAITSVNTILWQVGVAGEPDIYWMIAKLTSFDHCPENFDLILSEITQHEKLHSWKPPNHLWINPHMVPCLRVKRQSSIPVCDVPGLRCQAFFWLLTNIYFMYYTESCYKGVILYLYTHDLNSFIVSTLCTYTDLGSRGYFNVKFALLGIDWSWSLCQFWILKHIFLPNLYVMFFFNILSETILLNISDTIAGNWSNQSPLLTKRKSSMNISIDNQYCNSCIHLCGNVHARIGVTLRSRQSRKLRPGSDHRCLTSPTSCCSMNPLCLQ